MFFRAFGNYEAPKTPLGAAAGAGKLGGNKGLIVRAQRVFKPAAKQTRDKEFSAPRGRLSLLTFFGEAKKVSGVRCRTAQRH